MRIRRIIGFDFGSTVGPILFTVVAAVVALLTPPDPVWRISLAVVILFIGAIITIAVWRMARYVPYLWADEVRLRERSSAQLWIRSNGVVYMTNYWLSPASAGCDPRNSNYGRLDVPGLKYMLVHPGSQGYATALVIPPTPDAYTVQFTTENGEFREQLRIEEIEGRLVQRIVVSRVRDGAELFRYP